MDMALCEGSDTGSAVVDVVGLHELDPRFCEVIVERMARLVLGRQAEMVKAVTGFGDR